MFTQTVDTIIIGAGLSGMYGSLPAIQKKYILCGSRSPTDRKGTRGGKPLLVCCMID
ncbi:MAG: hypothetical protein KAJ25_05050 [Desulfobacula sp.]|nr:hypothetical protein [Desulfobacula sp.]